MSIVVLFVRCPEFLRDAVVDRANRRNQSQSWVACELLEAGLRDLEGLTARERRRYERRRGRSKRPTQVWGRISQTKRQRLAAWRRAWKARTTLARDQLAFVLAATPYRPSERGVAQRFPRRRDMDGPRVAGRSA